MYKLLIEEAGIQTVTTVGATGGYYDETKIVWDERKHGKLLSVTFGGLTRQGSKDSYSLTVDGTKKATHDSALLVRQTQQANIETTRAERKTKLSTALLDFNTLTEINKLALVKDLLEEVLG